MFRPDAAPKSRFRLRQHGTLWIFFRKIVRKAHDFSEK